LIIVNTKKAPQSFAFAKKTRILWWLFTTFYFKLPIPSFCAKGPTPNGPLPRRLWGRSHYCVGWGIDGLPCLPPIGPPGCTTSLEENFIWRRSRPRKIRPVCYRKIFWTPLSAFRGQFPWKNSGNFPERKISYLSNLSVSFRSVRTLLFFLFTFYAE